MIPPLALGPWEPQIRPTGTGCTVEPVRRGHDGAVVERLEHWFLLAHHGNAVKRPRTLRSAKRAMKLCAAFCREQNERDERVAETLAVFQALLG